jgi:hypothetical protein
VDARRARLRWTGWFALAVAAQWLAGYPDFVFDSFILLGVAWLFAAPSERRLRFAILSAAVVIGTAIAAVQIVAIGEAVADGPRGELQELFAGMRTVLLASGASRA